MATEFFNDYFVFVLSAFQGLAICFLDGLLLVSFLFNNSFLRRKEMLIIAGQAAAQLLFGLSAAVFGCYRIALVANKLSNQLVTAWSCVTFPPVPMTYISQQLVSAMNLFVSVDRLLAVAKPADYRQLGPGYALKVIASVTLYGVVSLITLLLSTRYGVSDAYNYTMICSGVSAPLFPQWYALYHADFVAVVSLLSVFIYVAVFITYQSAMRTAAKSLSTITETQQQANQRRLTITIGIITISSVVLFIMPMTLNAITISMQIPTPGRTFITPMLQANAILNTVIYVVRQSEIRAAMLKILTCAFQWSGSVNVGNILRMFTRTAPARINQRAG